jgi:hypothetical protein
MSALDQIVCRVPSGTGGPIALAAASLRDRSETDRWLNRLDPWLRMGAPLGRGYLSFGSQAALLRWKYDPATVGSWHFAHALVGRATSLSADYALQLPDLPAELPRLSRMGHLPQVAGTSPGARAAASSLEKRARSAGAVELLVPLLSRLLGGEQQVTMPWTAPLGPEAVIWGLVSILLMIGDGQPVSFLTYASGPSAPPAGRFVSFRQGVAAPPSDARYEQVAIGLATSYADGPALLRQTLLQHGIPAPADPADRNASLLDLWPGFRRPTGDGPTAGRIPARSPAADVAAGHDQTRNARTGGTRTVNTYSAGRTPATTARAQRPPMGAKVTCPICLHEIDDWERLPRWHWDSLQGVYAELKIPADIGRQQRARLQRGALVRCPDPYHVMQDEHYLPADYGLFGEPVVLGFIGVTRSGKSHLLTAMVGEIERGGLKEYGIDSRPIDHALHKRFLDERVRPLMTEGKVLPGTQEGVITFADAFLISPASGPDRPVALFDVAGGELTRVDDTKQFLDIADGLIFVVDPGQLNAEGLGDDTFNTVLDLVKTAGRLPHQVSAAIVLNKADMVRFEDPVALWLRSDRKVLDAAEFVRESADVYAYLYDQGAAAWTRPFRECDKATLHVASPTGGAGQRENDAGVFPRGVTPRRVLRPLVAMLAMTGVLSDAEAERVGI